MVREIEANELNELLNLYLYLHEKSVPDMTQHLKDTWEAILKDENHHILVNVIDHKIVFLLCLCNHPKFNKGYQTVRLYRKCCYHERLPR